MKKLIFVVAVLIAMLTMVPFVARSEVTPWIDMSFGSSLYGDYFIGNVMGGFDIWKTLVPDKYLLNNVFGISFYVGYETYMQRSEGIITFYPWNDIYTIGSRIVVGPVYLNLEHWCSHKVESLAEPKPEFIVPARMNTTVKLGVRFPIDRPLW